MGQASCDGTKSFTVIVLLFDVDTHSRAGGHGNRD